MPEPDIVQAEPATRALESLGWTKETTKTECIFLKSFGDIEEVLVFPRQGFLPTTQILQQIHFTGGIFIDDFQKAYEEAQKSSKTQEEGR